MKKILFWGLVASVVIGCERPVEPVDNDALSDETQKIENSHRISEEDAIASLMDFLESFKGQDTKSGVDYSSRRIKDIEPFKSRMLVTKSSDLAAADCEDILYVVNFEDEQGYAILAADDRIPADVLAVTESGSTSVEEIYRDYEAGERIYYPSYPMTGPGIIVDEAGYQHINPNTFMLYDAEVDDCLVGNFSIADDGLTEDDDNNDEGGTDVGGQLIPVGPPIMGGLLNYAIDNIGNPDNPGNNGVGPQIDTVIGGLADVPVVLYDRVVESSDVTYTCNVSNLLTFAVNWDQGTPFNDFFPFVGINKKADSGCVPLAIAKIMTYFEYPNNLSFNGITVDWEALKAGYSDPNFSVSAAALLRVVALNCFSAYLCGGTFTFPKLAALYLDDINYPDVNLVGYSTSLAKSMLDNGCPIFICSVPDTGWINYNLFKSHGWNIDGYKTKVTTKTKKYYKGEMLINTETEERRTTMVHCDFGWYGRCNGYFVSGIFDLQDSRVEYDDSAQGDTGIVRNYKWHLKIIDYERPY